jgi:hypothetical protein
MRNNLYGIDKKLIFGIIFAKYFMNVYTYLYRSLYNIEIWCYLGMHGEFAVIPKYIIHNKGKVHTHNMYTSV